MVRVRARVRARALVAAYSRFVSISLFISYRWRYLCVVFVDSSISCVFSDHVGVVCRPIRLQFQFLFCYHFQFIMLHIVDIWVMKAHYTYTNTVLYINSINCEWI